MDRYFKPQAPPAVRLTLSGPLTLLDQLGLDKLGGAPTN
jgi:hypothetical protein